MEDFFSFRRKLNMKKVIIAIIIVAILIMLLISSAVSKYKEYKIEKQKIEEENAKPYKTYTSTDNTFSIELSKNYALSRNNR
ncbi:MAG: hypothetical protein HFJ46_03910 [Clostridia bacterium]|nr:hypothetical protein [Clostridia bacterium]